MYDTILLALDASSTDRPIVEHVKRLAGMMHSRIVLLRVATGASAQFHGADAVGEEIDESRSYMDAIKREFEAAGISATTEMGYGEPAREIIKYANEKHCDLVAMGTHGHKLLADLFLGATATRVQHNLSIPVLLLRAK
jgi:nucleotide-binding universal stress UspA family protein